MSAQEISREISNAPPIKNSYSIACISNNDENYSLEIMASRALLNASRESLPTYTLNLIPNTNQPLPDLSTHFKNVATDSHGASRIAQFSAHLIHWKNVVKRMTDDLKKYHGIIFDPKTIERAIDEHLKNNGEEWRKPQPAANAPQSNTEPA